MTKTELIHELHRRLATATDEAPYALIPRSLLAETIAAIDPSPADGAFLETALRLTTPREYAILSVLGRAKGAIVRSERILERTGIVTEDSLWAHISRLRPKMVKHGWGEIHTVRGVGYAWERPTEAK